MILGSIVEAVIAGYTTIEATASSGRKAFKALNVRQGGDGSTLGTCRIGDWVAGIANPTDSPHSEGIFRVGYEASDRIYGVVHDNTDRIV